MCSARSKWLLALLAALAMAIAGATRYVNANQVTGNHDGSTWTNAYQDLQQALAVAQEGDEIWVAKSMPAQPAYIPSVRYPHDPNDPNEPNEPRRVTFRIPAGVKVYGGFRGYDDYSDPNTPFPGETDLSQRDPEHNLTILDGDVSQNDSLQGFPYGATFADNAFHVVFFHGTATLQNTPTKLSGFVIRNGHADGLDEFTSYFGFPDDMGGGILSLYALFEAGSSPRLDRLVLDHNYADVAGAGILLAGKAPTPLANCRFDRNWVGDPNKPNIDDGHGAGLAVHKDHGGPATLQNAIFYENHIVRGTGAGIFYPNIAGDSWANLTFYGNECDAPPSNPGEYGFASAFYCPPNAGSH